MVSPVRTPASHRGTARRSGPRGVVRGREGARDQSCSHGDLRRGVGGARGEGHAVAHPGRPCRERGHVPARSLRAARDAGEHDEPGAGDHGAQRVGGAGPGAPSPVVLVRAHPTRREDSRECAARVANRAAGGRALRGARTRCADPRRSEEREGQGSANLGGPRFVVQVAGSRASPEKEPRAEEAPRRAEGRSHWGVACAAESALMVAELRGSARARRWLVVTAC